MSNAHKGSRLILKDQVIATNFSSFHADYNVDATAIKNGILVEPLAQSVFAMVTDGKFGDGIAIDQGVNNLWTGALGVYNNYASNGQMTHNIYQLSETYMGEPIYRLEMTPISANALTSIQNNHSSHGVMGSNMSYASGNNYMSSIYWRPHKTDMTVGGTASNISGWTDVGTEEIHGGWKRSSAKYYADTTRSDNKFWSFRSPSAILNETLVIDWVCPQIEISPFASAYVKSSRALGKLWYPKEVFNHKKSTISMWFKIPYMHRDPDTNAGIQGNWYHPIIEFAPPTGAGVSYYSLCAGPEPSSWNRRLSQRAPVAQDSPLAILDDTWYHLSISIDGANIKTYINGKLEISTTATEIDNNTNYVLMVGGGYHGKPNIIINDLYIDNSVVHTQEEIQAWYVSEKPFYNPYDYRSFSF